MYTPDCFLYLWIFENNGIFLSLFDSFFFRRRRRFVATPLAAFVEDLDGPFGEQLPHLWEVSQSLVEIHFVEDEKIGIPAGANVGGPAVAARHRQ